MASYSSLNGPGSIGDAILPLAFLSDDDFGMVSSLVLSERSFSPRKDQLKSLSEQTSLAPDILDYLFVALAYLYNHVQSSMKTGMSYPDALSSTAEELSTLGPWDETNAQQVRGRLEPLLEPRSNHTDFRKIERLKTGFQAHAVGFSSLVELRPKFSDDDPETQTMSIEGYVPAIEFRITTDSSENKNIVFQLTVEALSEFKKAVDRLDKKVLILKQQNLGSAQVIDI